MQCPDLVVIGATGNRKEEEQGKNSGGGCKIKFFKVNKKLIILCLGLE